MRHSLREDAFEQWNSCKFQGIGVHHFKENQLSNKFIYDKEALSGSGWTNAIKLSIKLCAPSWCFRGWPSTGTGEKETPAHLLGNCPHNMLLVTRRVKHAVRDLLEARNFQCFEEVYAIDAEGPSRYIDIVAFDSRSKLA
ncbi:hypothetical protein O3M35_008158 [Rhynocoris fuscipes]|uniref:Uncharacterized protein n=1 Tax=Rhynocoris fuscipes TaxID=488301 RepID=A0AAW1D6S8_9HEMI